MEAYLISVIRGKRGIIPGILRLFLCVLAAIYCTGLKTYLLIYRLGLRRPVHLPCPVVCIGNLTTGGTGKTPTTQTVCRLLVEQGKKVCVLIRGYGGQNEFGCAIVSDGERVMLDAREAGDEAYLLARTLPGVPVVVGKDRIRTGRHAYEQFKPDVIVMDDGFQHWRLHRDLDIVLLNACEPFDNGWTFPRGMLREPPGHLKRAGMILLTNARRAGAEQIKSVKARLSKLAVQCPVVSADLEPVALLDLKGREEHSIKWLDGRRVGAFSALGNPASFESMLGDNGAILAAKFRFRDHQTITLRELERVLDEFIAVDADALLTTEKDAVKLPWSPMPLPLLVLRVAMHVNEEAFAATLCKAVERPNVEAGDTRPIELKLS